MLFSVITINYNHADGLRRTINSVVQQSCKDFEYIIIDGASTDGSIDAIKENQEHIDYWVSESDGGIYPAMNKGVKAAHGDYCIFMNSGDEFYSADVIKNIKNFNLEEDIVCGDICFGESNVSPNPDVVTMRTFYKHTLYHQASFIKTELLRCHLYDESMRSAADWKFFMHELIFRNATYKHIPVVIARFELGGISSVQSEVSRNEVLNELKACFPERVLLDYEDYVFGITPYRKLVTTVEKIPKIRKMLYRINVFFLKILNIKLKAKWIHELTFSDEG